MNAVDSNDFQAYRQSVYTAYKYWWSLYPFQDAVGRQLTFKNSWLIAPSAPTTMLRTESFTRWGKAMLLELRQISVPPGQRVLLQDVTWQEFETILDELGDHRGSRLAYDNGLLEIMMPLVEHEDDKEIVGDLVKALLEELDVEFRSLGSTTFKKPTAQGLEPDQCFYIQNETAIRGKKRVNLSIDPPPDLAIEIDVTSRTHPSIYEALKVPELWRLDRETLQINVLNFGKYQEVPASPNFPGLALKQMIPHALKESKTLGRNKVLKAFRQWIREQIQ